MNASPPTLMLPLLWRRATIKEGSLDRIDNYVEVILDPATARQQSAEAGAFDEDLDFTETALRIHAIDQRADPPDSFDALAAFWPFGCNIVAGRAEIAIKLTRSSRFAKAVRKIIAGDTRTLWIAYRAHHVEIEDRPGDVPLYRVTSWEPVEVAAARRNTVPDNMAIVTRIAPTYEEPKMDPEIRTRALGVLARKGLPASGQMVETVARALGANPRAQAAAAIDETIADFRAGRSTSNHVLGPAHAEARAAAITTALLHRHDPDKHALTADARDFRGMSLLEIARESLEVQGVRTAGMDRTEIAASALRTGGMMATTDFPSILSGIAHKSLRDAYQATAQTFRPFVQETTVLDFQPVVRNQLSEAPQFEKVNEHGQFKHGVMGESREEYAIATYGRIISITRQVIINDDLDAFTRIPAAFGVKAADLESDLVWGQILGPQPMGDGLPVFHQTHRNVGVPIALGTVGLGGAKAQMRTQRSMNDENIVSVTPRHLIVPATLETVADQITAKIAPTKTDDAVPQAIRSLQPVVEVRLDHGFTDPATGAYIPPSATAWYLATTPGAIDTVELAYLEGNRGVYTETRTGFDIDGIEIKARLDVAAKAIDWRGFYRNSGAPA